MPTLLAVADLRRGLSWEVDWVLEPFIGFSIGLMAMDGRHTLAVRDELEETVFQLPTHWMGRAGEGATLTPMRMNDPPSDSSNLPWTGGGRQRRAAWGRNPPTAPMQAEASFSHAWRHHGNQSKEKTTNPATPNSSLLQRMAR
jgi:hypothetical protein